MNISNFFHCKSIEALIAESSNGSGLDRTLGAFQLIMLGIGAIVGAGIFVLIGIAVGKHAGPAVILSFTLAGLACICTAFCYAELASVIPISGSSYTFAYATLGELPAFLLGGVILMAYCLTSATVASGWSGYIQSFLFDYGIQVPAIFSKHFGCLVTLADGTQVTALFDLPALLITSLIFIIVLCGTEVSAIVNTTIVIIKMTVLLSLVIIGSTKIDISNWQPFIPANTGTFGEFGISGIVAGASIIVLAYTGFDVVASAAQETKNPQQNLPIGIIGSLLICILFYVAVSAVLTGIVPYPDLDVTDPMAVAVNKINMPWLINFVKLGAILGLASVVLVMMYGCVRILFAITHDGLLPKELSKIHTRYHTPYRATILVGSVIAFSAAVMPVDKLVEVANFGILSSFIVVCMATIVLRYKQPNLTRTFKCPLVPFIPLAGIALFVTILCGLSKTTFLVATGWIFLLLLIYLFYSHGHALCRNN